jgi:hypothetical protein
MSDEITLSELRELSAGAIQALPRATPVVSGDTMVAILVPVRTPPPERVAAALAEIDAAAAARTPEEVAEIEAFLDEIERR